MGLLETKCKRRAVIGVKPDHDLPERSIVYNAPRPIVEMFGEFAKLNEIKEATT